MDFVVPVAVEPITFEVNLREFFVVDFGSRRVSTVIHCGMDGQALCGSRSGDEVDDNLEADERFSRPVLADEAEQTMLNLVPLAGAWRKVANCDPQACL